MGIMIANYFNKIYIKSNLEDTDLVIDYLITSRKKKLKGLIIPKNPLNFFSKNTNIINLEKQFYIDINNENNLILLLNEYNKYLEITEFHKFLFKYMDILSCNNRKNYTKIDDEYESNVSKFQNFIELLIKNDYDTIKTNLYFQGYHDLAERDKFIYSDQFQVNILKKYYIELDKNKNISEKEKILKKDELIKIYLKDRVKSKISYTNKELFFESILKCYYNTIIIKGKKKVKEIGFLISYIRNMFNDAIQRVNNNNFENNDEVKTLILILFLPLIINDVTNLYDISLSYTEEKERNIFLNFEENEDKELVIKKNNKELIRLNNANIWNKYKLDTNLIETNIENLKEIDLLGYVKLKYFQSYNFYNYDPTIKEFNRNLTKYILQSKTMKSVYAYLHPEISFDINNKDKNYIFDNDEIVEEYLNSIIYVPSKMESYGYTIKDLLLVFIDGLPLLSNNNKEFAILSKLSSFQVLSIHEGGSHWSSAYNSYQYQNDDIRNSPRFNKHFFEQNNMNINDKNIIEYLKMDGGDIIELLLFSRKIKFFKVKEILFLLNENSYDTDFRNFNKNFTSINEKNIDLYEEACKDPKLKTLLTHLKITKEDAEELIVPNCSLNFKRNGEIERSKCLQIFNYD